MCVCVCVYVCVCMCVCVCVHVCMCVCVHVCTEHGSPFLERLCTGVLNYHVFPSSTACPHCIDRERDDDNL